MLNLHDIGEEIITEGMNAVRIELIDNQARLKLRSSGESAESLNVTVASNDKTVAGQLRGFGRWAFQEHGHGPTPSGKPSREMVEKMKKWAVRRGMDESAGWPIAMKVAKHGTKVPNPYNPGGVMSDVLNADNIRKKVSPQLRQAIFKELRSYLFKR